MRPMARLLSVGAGVLLLATLSSNASAAKHARVLERCVHAGPHTRIVKFRAPGGHRTAAAILGVGSTGVVLSNQSGNRLCPWLPFARKLTARGIRVLVYNYKWGTTQAEAKAAAAGL